MTILSLLVGTITSQVLFSLTKILFIGYINLDNPIIFGIFFLLLVGETIAVVRRMGVLNLFESVFLSVLWLIASLFIDLIATTAWTGRGVYAHPYFWATYAVIIGALIIFHKKSHIEARKKRAAAKK